MSQKTILVIDDEPTILEVMAETLENQDYLVKTAANGEDGLKLYSESSVNVIVLDLNMPRMNGYEFLEKLKRQPALSGIIVLTALGSKADSDLAQKLGATKVMSKPFKGKELVAAVREILGE